MAPIVDIIAKQSIDIHFEKWEDGMTRQDSIARFFYERLLPGMEILFREICDNDHGISVERLEIDCGVLTEKNWEEECLDRVLWDLRQQLLAANKKKTDPVDIAGSFFFYLHRGYLPWNGRVVSIREFEDHIIFDEVFLFRLKESVHPEIVISRLLDQFSERFIADLVRAIHLTDRLRRVLFDQENAGEAAVEPTPASVLRSFMLGENAAIPFKGGPPAAKEKPLVKMKKLAGQKDQAVYIHNAGLVILHPFLSALFSELKLTKDGQWVNEEARATALLVTAFLVSGEAELPEFDLVLDKIICGLEPAYSVPMRTPLPAGTKAACEELLVEVIGHWSALKNTSAGSFRETFLHRDGKLSKADNGWLLQVEQRPVDVLLSRLPWGIGIVKLPWMDGILYVEWV